MNFEFLYPQAFWLLLPVALVVAVKNYRQSSSSLIASHLEKALKLQSDSKKSAQFWLTLLCLVLITAIAGPSFETQTRPAFQSSSARVLVLDMSRSVYANDIKPSRLAQIKYKAQDLLPLITDGQTGLVAYAGDAYILSPLTTDSATLGNLITNLSPEIMPFQGARADLAVKQAIDMMKQAGLSNGEIILFSDDLGQSELKAIEAMLSSHSWKLSVLAFGTTGGAPIALPDGSLLTDKSGNTVVAKTHFTNLEQAAKVGRGHYTTYRSDNQDISSLIQTSDVTANLKKEGEQSVDIRVNNGYWLLPLVLVLLLPLFRKGVVFCSPLLAILFGFNSNSAEVSIIDSAFNNQNQLGYHAFQDKDYESAKNLFSNKQWLAAAQYENGDYQQAIDNLQGESDISALYNLGNAYAQHGELEKAADMYQQVLNQQPNHADAKFNLNLVKDAMKQQQQQSQSNANSSSKENSSGETAKPDSERTKNNSQPEHSDNNKESRNQQAKQPQEKDNTTKASTEKSASASSGEQQSQASEEQKQAQLAKETTQQNVDPDLRKLEQIESVRDPSYLLRAQMLLQSKNKEVPTSTGKDW